MTKKILCIYCNQPFKYMKIECLECENFNICLPCFKCGAEIGKHKSSHTYKYHIVEIPLFDKWSIDEEIKLIESIENHGLGNWMAISNDFGNKRSPDELKNHYETYYINGSIGKLCLNKALDVNEKVNETNGQDCLLVGYSAKRDEYDINYKNDAENLIKDLHYEPTDLSIEKKCKFALFDQYSSILVERQKRKAFVTDYDIINQYLENKPNSDSQKQAVGLKKKATTHQAKSLAQYPKVMNCLRVNLNCKCYEALKPFARFVPFESFERALKLL